MAAQLLLALLAVHAEGARDDWVNVTAYRVTPITDKGITNMDTADAAGDVYFGLSQLLLPYMCGGQHEHMSLWCNNRKWLSGGQAWMVYRKFTIEAKKPFGDYSPCNPDPTTGVFSCDRYGGGGGPSWPKVCNGYHEHHSHYLDGDPIGAPMLLPANGSVGACCATCTKDKHCDGWKQLNSSGVLSCVLLSNGTLVNNVNGTVSAQKESGQSHEYCWYQDRQRNATWGPYCSRSNCSCDAMEHLSLGVEQNAMCWNRNNKPHNRTLRPTNATHWWNYTDLDCDPGVEEGQCNGVEDCKTKCMADPYCGGFNSDHHLKYADCGSNLEKQGGSGMFLYWLRDRPMPGDGTRLELEQMRAPPPPPNYDNWMQSLACLMSGNWYSTQVWSNRESFEVLCVAVDCNRGVLAHRPLASAKTPTTRAAGGGWCRPPRAIASSTLAALTTASRARCARTTRAAGRSAPTRTTRPRSARSAACSRR